MLANLATPLKFFVGFDWSIAENFQLDVQLSNDDHLSVTGFEPHLYFHAHHEVPETQGFNISTSLRFAARLEVTTVVPAVKFAPVVISTDVPKAVLSFKFAEAGVGPCAVANNGRKIELTKEFQWTVNIGPDFGLVPSIDIAPYWTLVQKVLDSSTMCLSLGHDPGSAVVQW